MTPRKGQGKDAANHKDFSNRCILAEIEDGVTPEKEAALRKMLSMHCKAKARQK